MIINSRTIPKLKYARLHEAQEHLQAEHARLFAQGEPQRHNARLHMQLLKEVRLEIAKREETALQSMPITAVLRMAGVPFIVEGRSCCITE